MVVPVYHAGLPMSFAWGFWVDVTLLVKAAKKLTTTLSDAMPFLFQASSTLH